MDNGTRDQWWPGDRAWFEYHCYEGHDSADAELWYRSHSAVTVVKDLDEENERVRPILPTLRERGEAGMAICYSVEFEDGYIGTAYEDELMTGSSHFYRPDPPPRPMTSQA